MTFSAPNTQPATDSEPFSQLSQKIEEPWAVLIPYNTKFCDSATNFHLTEDLFKFGRDAGCDKVCSENEFPSKIFPQISKVHFIIRKLSINGAFITILEDTSSNGTYVNADAVGKNNTFVLTHKDVISICPVKFKVYEFNDLRKRIFDEIPTAVTMCYSTLKLIDKGGFGAVYHVLKKKTAAPYAMKEIKFTDHGCGPSEFAEIEILRKIEDHDHIIKLHDCMLVDKKIFLILDYMRGGDLRNYLMSKERLSEPVTKHIFYQIALGCAYLHSKKIVHRDIKTSIRSPEQFCGVCGVRPNGIVDIKPPQLQIMEVVERYGGRPNEPISCGVHKMILWTSIRSFEQFCGDCGGRPNGIVDIKPPQLQIMEVVERCGGRPNKSIHLKSMSLPANILLKDAEVEFPTIKITDFGLSKILKRDETDINTVCGTRNFKAPEMTDPIKYRKFDDRVDVWSLGVMLYLCLSGRFPSKAGDFAPVEIWNKISIAAKLLIRRCLITNWRSRIRAKEICVDQWFIYDPEFKNKRNRPCHNENDNPVDVQPAKKSRLM